jgi:hypothetical protein
MAACAYPAVSASTSDDGVPRLAASAATQPTSLGSTLLR